METQELRFKQGDRVKTRFGMSNPPKYKYGIFHHYENNYKIAFFSHTKSGKILKRLSREMEGA
jgi:hypothetical protein